MKRLFYCLLASALLTVSGCGCFKSKEAPKPTPTAIMTEKTNVELEEAEDMLDALEAEVVAEEAAEEATEEILGELEEEVALEDLEELAALEELAEFAELEDELGEDAFDFDDEDFDMEALEGLSNEESQKMLEELARILEEAAAEEEAEEAMRVAQSAGYLFDTIEFKENSAEIANPEALDRNITLAKQAAREGKELHLMGHASDLDKDAAVLSAKRAEAVRDLFVKAGVDKEMIHVASAGSARPAVWSEADAHAEALALNQRVEVTA